MSLGDRLKEYRKQKGFSQEKLAEIVSISKMSIRRYEANERQPTLETLDKIAEALGVDVWDLYNNCTLPMSPKTEKIDTMNNLMVRLNNPGQEKAIEQVELLTKIPEYRREK